MPRARPKGRRPQPLDHWPALRAELVALIGELERFPTPHDLERRGRYDLMRALVHHGGSAAVARRLAEEAEAARANLAADNAAAPADN
jgi:hypothetical protein